MKSKWGWFTKAWDRTVVESTKEAHMELHLATRAVETAEHVPGTCPACDGDVSCPCGGTGSLIEYRKGCEKRAREYARAASYAENGDTERWNLRMEHMWSSLAKIASRLGRVAA